MVLSRETLRRDVVGSGRADKLCSFHNKCHAVLPGKGLTALFFIAFPHPVRGSDGRGGEGDGYSGREKGGRGDGTVKSASQHRHTLFLDFCGLQA